MLLLWFHGPMMKRLILASQSPRRKDLLEAAGYEFLVIPVKISETLDKNLNLDAQIQDLAKRKSEALADSGNLLKDKGFLLISADTVVVLGDEVLGKPANPRDAEEYLAKLSGQTHQVKTGVCFYDLDQDRAVTGIDTSHVTFFSLPMNAIREYVATGESLDKAGAYGIQGEARKFVREIQGSYSNVMGLPLELVERMMRENEWDVHRRKS